MSLQASSNWGEGSGEQCSMLYIRIKLGLNRIWQPKGDLFSAFEITNRILAVINTMIMVIVNIVEGLYAHKYPLFCPIFIQLTLNSYSLLPAPGTITDHRGNVFLVFYVILQYLIDTEITLFSSL